MMMLLHEAGHLGAAWVTGGTVQRLVWHPLAFSRTDVHPNPAPLCVVWAGPMAGCLLPMLAERVFAAWFRETLFIARLFAGFCLLSNGAYIALGLAVNVLALLLGDNGM